LFIIATEQMGSLFSKKATLHADSEDSAEYQSTEDIADYQHPKPTEYNPPNTHYQTPKTTSAGRTKSFVGPLENKPWFHGHIPRGDAEKLIEEDGQFLVRESSSSIGQYVLSGMKDGQHRHLLLVDPEGQVRTKDRIFATVEELISYHQKNNLPIISGGSDVHILDPVCRNSQGNNNKKVSHDNSFKI